MFFIQLKTLMHVLLDKITLVGYTIMPWEKHTSSKAEFSKYIRPTDLSSNRVNIFTTIAPPGDNM